MAKFPVRTSAFLMAMCAVVPTSVATSANASPNNIFSSCQAIRQANPSAPDGNYVLFNNGHVFTVYCHAMQTAPAEYINLAKTGRRANFSQYTAGGASPGTDVRTTFTKLRVNPATLTVDIGDLTFATSTGSLRHSGSQTVTSMPYGVAMSCVAPLRADGRAKIDLRGTPYRVDNTFATGGFEPAGTARIRARNQVVDLTGGGFCGWMMPAPVRFDPFNPSPGLYNLKLNCAERGTTHGHRHRHRPVCYRLSTTTN